jgi:hypothetical protein
VSFRHALAFIVFTCVIYSRSIALADQGAATNPATAPTTAVAATAPTAPTNKSYSIENHGELKLTIPAGWNVQEEPAAPGIPRTLRLDDPSTKFEMLISILPPPQGMPDFNSKTKLRAIAEAQGKHLLTTSKETKVTLEEIRNAPGGGFVYTFSDKAPAPGSYEYITGGVVGVGELVLSTTMLMHEKNPPQRATGLDVLASATQVKSEAIAAAATPSLPAAAGAATEPTGTLPAPSATSPAPQPAAAQRLAVSLPDRMWQLSLDQGALQVLEDEMSPDHKARHLSAVDSNTGVNISIFLEPAATMGDAKVARSFFFDRLKRSPLQIREDKFTDLGAVARVDYVLPDANQRHANLYFAKEGIWIDVHISVEDLKGEKRSLIDDLARSVRIEPKPAVHK